MQPNQVKAKLMRGELVFGVSISSPDPTQVEFAGEAGMDFVRIDCEHGPMSLETVENMIRAAEACDVTPLARVPVCRHEVVLQYMDRGVAGITFPHINTAEEAAVAVSYMKFAPMGKRGFTRRGGIARWTLGIQGNEHDFANRETMIICLIEEVEGYKNIEKIVSVPGVDVIMVGAGDLSASMGHNKMDHPEVQRVLHDGIRKVRRAGKPVGAIVSAANIAGAKELIDAGVQMLHLLAGPLFILAMKDFRTKVST